MITPRFGLLCYAVIIIDVPTLAKASTYRFTNVVDDSGPYVFLGLSDYGQTINVESTIAFYSRLSGSGEGIFTGSGGPITTIADTRDGTFAGFSTFSPPAINDNGTVAFLAGVRIGGTGIYTGNGGPVTTIADSQGEFNSFGVFDVGPSINNSGIVAFFAVHDDGRAGIFTGNGGPVTTIADNSGFFNSFGDAFPAVNAGGMVAFRANISGGGSGIFTGNGATTTTITDTKGPFSSFFEVPSINDHGMVAFGADLDVGRRGIFTGSGGAINTIADSLGAFDEFGVAAIDNNGCVAFLAILDDNTPSELDNPVGIFIGDDPIADKVVQTGDALFGSIVTRVEFYRGLNDWGDIAFEYELADRREGIAIASIVPEPTSIVAIAFIGSLLPLWQRQVSRRLTNRCS